MKTGFEKLTIEGLKNAVFCATGNDYLYRLAVEFLTRANKAKTIEEKNNLFAAGKNEIEGLDFVGYLDKAKRNFLFKTFFLNI